MLYLYGIIDQPCSRLPLPSGLGEAAPDIFEYTGLGAVASPLNGGAPEGDGANVRRHMEVLDALMLTQRTVLPVRFGSVFSEREDLNAFISGSRETLLADLKRLRGHVEVGVRASDRRPQVLTQEPEAEEDFPSASEAAALPGARYLAVKKAEADHRANRKRALDVLAAAVVEPFKPLAAASAWRALPASLGRPSVSLALLLLREQLDAFRLALAELRRSEPWLEILCAGPRPPYSFVSGVQASADEGSGALSGALPSAT